MKHKQTTQTAMNNSNGVAQIALETASLNLNELDLPSHAEIVSYVGLYGTTKVADVVSIAKDVLSPGVEFVRDNLTHSVVYCDEIGVTFHVTSSFLTGSSPFNNTHVVSFDWSDFSNWEHMPTDDMCTIDKQWVVKDGVATLYQETDYNSLNNETIKE